MARTPTKQIELEFTAPDFMLPDTISGNSFGYGDLRGEKGTVVAFICNHCPFVIHVIEELVNIGKEYKEKGFGFIMISSNDIVNYPADSPDNMKIFAKKHQFEFPYLFDETQEIATRYDAVCTPDFSVFDKNDSCIYRGQLDDSRPGNEEPINGKDLRKVLDYLLENRTIDFKQNPSVGCSIKWKNNN